MILQYPEILGKYVLYIVYNVFIFVAVQKLARTKMLAGQIRRTLRARSVCLLWLAFNRPYLTRIRGRISS